MPPFFVSTRIYEHIYGNVEKKDLCFQKIIEENFGHKKLVELITIVHEDQNITVQNAKQIMMSIVDGDDRMPSAIAEEQGFVGGSATSDEVLQAVAAALSDPENAQNIKKVQDGDARGIMPVVGRVMRAVNRRGDPVVIKQLLLSGI